MSRPIDDRVKRLLFAIVSALIAATAFLGFFPCAFAGDLPFYPGEKLTFQVRWAFIPAGEATLQILPVERLNGAECLRFTMTARTYEAIDLFYKVRDRVDAYTDLGMTRSLFFKKLQEGRTRRNIVVDFNWESGVVQYSNFGEKRDPIPLLPGSFDPLSVFYAFRLHALEEGRELDVPVTDGKRCVLGKARVIRRETIRIGSGEYDTYLVEAEMKQIGGVFEKSEKANLQIWVTADQRRIPVRMKSRVAVGSFVAELTSAEKGTPSPTD